MTNLKTLKDFEKERLPDKSIVGGYNEIRKSNQLDLLIELKQEAIKWVKEEHWDSFIGWLRFERGLSDEGIEKLSKEEFTQLFIEYFFNITEEEIQK